MSAHAARYAIAIPLVMASFASWAMDVTQLRSLAGASLLDLRVDALFEQCGLPSAIVDTATDAGERQALHWNQVTMNLSSKSWEIHYSAKTPPAKSTASWRNAAPAKDACIGGLAFLVLDAKGESGALSVKKRDDDQGYITTYQVPDNPYAAHQIVGIAAILEHGMSVAEITRAFGKPDEIIKRDKNFTLYRYWVVRREGQMPLAAFAVDFEVITTTKQCGRYSAYSSGVKFVQDKLDTLTRAWQKAYVID